MFAPSQPLSTCTGNVPLALVWAHPTGRFSVEIPFRVMSHWREFFASETATSGLLTARRCSIPHESNIFLLDFEPLSPVTRLSSGVINRLQNDDSDRVFVGLVTSNMAESASVVRCGDIRNLMKEFAEPRLVLTASREDDQTIASLFSWAATGFDAIHATFPLDWRKLESQNYAPFRPFFWSSRLYFGCCRNIQ